MAYESISLLCKGCGNPIAVGDKECPAGHPVNVSTFTSVKDMPMPIVNKYANAYRKELSEDPDNQDLNHSIAICYLKLKLYDKALPAFEKAMEENFDNSETFFYAAVCLLQGKKAFLHQRPTINKILEYLDAAIMIEPKGIYYYFMAYIKYDYFKRKFFNVSPNYQETLAMAVDYGLSQFDVEQLYGILGVERPECL